MTSLYIQDTLLVFEEQIELIKNALKTNVIRMANSRIEPQKPIRPDREITYDETGLYVLPNSGTGISLAASFKQLEYIYRPKMTKWLILVDRNCAIPEGLKLNPDNEHHWSIVVTRKMLVAEFNQKVGQLIQQWKIMGRFIRYE